MLATATGNYDVTNVTYNENKCHVVTWTVYLESSKYPSSKPTPVTTSHRCYAPHCLLVP